jgi:ATP-binding cassette subfamily C protein LapB
MGSIREALGSDDAAGLHRCAADACLRPLLDALDWTGDARHLCDALPGGQVVRDFQTLAAVLGRLDLCLVAIKGDVGIMASDPDVLPALLLTPDGDIWVILRKAELGFFQVFQGMKGMPAIVEQRDLAGRLFHVRRKDVHGVSEATPPAGIGVFLDGQRRQVRQLFAITFCINCLALALPVYLMAVYDLAIGTHSQATLAALAGMIIVITAAEMTLRELRARALARFAVRMQMSVTAGVFERLMRLPAQYVENASVAGQLNRLRGFESVKDLFSGPLASAILDLPFIVIFVAAVFAIGGSLGWFLVGFIALMALLGSIFVPRARMQSQRAGSARSNMRTFRMDLTRHISAIRDSGAEVIWVHRYRELIGRQLSTGLATQNIGFAEQTLAQGLSMIAGGLVVGCGALQVIDGTLMVGALTAVMAIVWRVLSPIQTAYLNVTRVFRIIDTAKQLRQLMKLPQENSRTFRSPVPRHGGDITLENVGLRQGSLALPVLRGIDLRIQAGQFVVLAGAPGPSRSALLKLIANLYQPSFGRILIGGCDVRQFDSRELRRCAALVSDEQILFSGTLVQNLLLANPLADERQLRAALADADLADYVDQLPDGIHTDLTETIRSGMNPLIAQKIRLARSYVLSPSIYLLDEPSKNLDQRGQDALVRKLNQLKGTATIVVRTSHEQIVKLADRGFHLQAGQLVAGRPGGEPGTGQQSGRPPAAAPVKGKASR